MTAVIKQRGTKILQKVEKKSNEVVDKILGKIVSRKLTVFIVASYGMFHGNIESSDWTIIAGIYIGSETVISLIKEYQKIKHNYHGQTDVRED